MDTNTDEPPDRPHITPAQHRRRRWLIVGGTLVTLAAVGTVAGFFVWKEIRRSKQRRVVEQAQTFLEKKDGPQAVASLRQALQMNPRDVAANRMMADMAEKIGSRQAIFWRRIVAELEPTLANRLAWAESCVHFGEPALGEQALAGASEADKKSAACQHMTGLVAQALKQMDKAGASLAEAVRLEPKNERYQLELAALRLLAGDAEARATVERLASSPTLGRSARRTLFQEAMKKNDATKAVQIAQQLQSAPDAPFEDRLLYLSVLRQLRRREFDGYLSDLQEGSLGNPHRLAALIAWLNRNDLAMLASEWGQRLPNEIRSQVPIPAALAETYANLRDWPKVGTLVAEGNWQELDYMRLALYARALREDGDLRGFWVQWNSAVKAAGDAPERLVKLAEFATASKWQTEVNEIRWAVAKGKTNQHWALAALWRESLAARDTRAMLAIASRLLELDPKNTANQHNVASLAFLINSNVTVVQRSEVERAQRLAGEAYESSGKNPTFAATYAYSLYFQGRTEEAIALMRSLPDAVRENPASAIYFAIILADGGQREEAAKYLELAKREPLLSEERDLVARTEAKLARSASEAPSPP